VFDGIVTWKCSQALAEAAIQGEVAGQRAVMRPLGLDDLDTLQGFIEAMPESHGNPPEK